MEQIFINQCFSIEVPQNVWSCNRITNVSKYLFTFLSHSPHCAIKFVNKSNTSSSITLNTQVRKGIMTLDTIGIGSGINSNNDILTIKAGYARALPDNYLTSVSGLTVKIENNNLIIS